MKDISRYQSGMGFYQQMPDTYTLVLNSDNETIKAILADANGKEDTIEQIIDLALLQTGLLKGAALDKFIKRSYKLTK
jgi:molecular chaperone HtpG